MIGQWKGGITTTVGRQAVDNVLYDWTMEGWNHNDGR